MNISPSIGIIGAGSWGTALAEVLAENGYHPLFWTRSNEISHEINSNHTNSLFLPGTKLHKSITATSNIENLQSLDTIIITVPTQYIREVLTQHNCVLKDKIIISGSKGIEVHTLLTVSGILKDIGQTDDDHYVVLSGPSHAEEVVQHVPTTVMAASSNQIQAEYVQNLFNNSYFRVYTSTDTIGAELGGALKNVIAIAAGIVDGLKMGDNTKAALITRGLAEMSRLGTILGADPRTFSGLSGLGDLFVTCSSKHSRNRHVGEEIGKGRNIKEIISEMNMVAEGVATTESAWQLSNTYQVDMPIIEQMHQILFNNKNPMQAIYDLMIREKKSEHMQ